MSYEERVRHAYHMYKAAVDAKLERRYIPLQPQFLRTLYEKALEIALEELDKGHDESVEVVPYSTSPSNIVVNAAKYLGDLYRNGQLFDTPDHEYAINYYKLSHSYAQACFSMGGSLASLALKDIYRSTGNLKAIVELELSMLEQHEFEFVQGVRIKVIAVLRDLLEKGEYEQALAICDEYRRLDNACDFCVYGNGDLNDLPKAEDNLRAFIDSLPRIDS